MSVTPCARADCGQMDGTRHSDPGARNDALCRAATRDRRHLAKNADANFAQPRARWPGATQSASGRPAESRIFSHKAGANLDRAATRSLPMVGKTFGRAAGKSCPGESCRRGRRSQLIEYRSRGPGFDAPVTAIVYRAQLAPATRNKLHVAADQNCFAWQAIVGLS